MTALTTHIPAQQLPLVRVIELPEFIECKLHGEWNWACFYDDDEIIEMIDEQGFIDCPYCLAEIVGIE